TEGPRTKTRCRHSNKLDRAAFVRQGTLLGKRAARSLESGMMRSRIAASLIGLGMLLVASLGSVEAAETLEKTFYTVSTTLWFKVNDTPLRKLLPEGWEPVQNRRH